MSTLSVGLDPVSRISEERPPGSRGRWKQVNQGMEPIVPDPGRQTVKRVGR